MGKFKNFLNRLLDNNFNNDTTVETTSLKQETQNVDKQTKRNLRKDKEIWFAEKMEELEKLKQKYNFSEDNYEDVFKTLEKANCENEVMRKIFALLLLKENRNKTYQTCAKKAKELIAELENKVYLKSIASRMENMKKDKKLVDLINKFVQDRDLDYIEIFAIPCKNIYQGSDIKHIGYYGHYEPFFKKEEILNCDKNIQTILNIGLNSYTNVVFDRLQIIKNFSGKVFREQLKEYEENKWFNNDRTLKKRVMVDIDFVDDNPIFDEIIYFKNALKQNGYLKKDLVDDDALYLLLAITHREKQFNKFNSLKEKYNLSDEDDMDAIKKLYNSGYGYQEIIEYVALLHYFYDTENSLSYRDFINFLKDKVISEIERYKSKNYLDNIINGTTSKTTLSDIDIMSGIEFETFISKLFKKLGFETEITKASGDQGIDVLATKNDTIIAIQTKCYNGVVGNHAIMEAVGGMKFYNANKCMVITNSTFTKSAKDLAKANNVELWDRQILKEKLGEF